MSKNTMHDQMRTKDTNSMQDYHDNNIYVRSDQQTLQNNAT